MLDHQPQAEKASIQDHAQPSVTVDVVPLTVRDKRLCVGLIDRTNEPFQGKMALPGVFVGIDRNLDESVKRALDEKAGIALPKRRRKGAATPLIEQLYTFDDLARDPRWRVISVAYLAILPPSIADQASDGTTFVPITGLQRMPKLAFDHNAIINEAVKRVRGRLGYTPICLAFMDSPFTLRQIWDTHCAIIGKAVAYPRFRTQWTSNGFIEPTGDVDDGSPRRPALLYRPTS